MWMINGWVDSLLILLTPLVAIPALFMLVSPGVGMEVATVSVIVTAFFATGHHLPGLLRAYGDRELFSRFKWRFVLAPPLVFLAYFPLYTYHFGLYRLIILTWATWHGFMQLYGFVRIYDAKVGSTAKSTARWDWWVCLLGFITPQLLRPEQRSEMLNHWYTSGGFAISPWVLNLVRWGAVSACLFVLLGFTANYVWQSIRGTKPNPLKVVMLASGIGVWWFAICYVEELILGIALFDICHDIQYLAIVWFYNCRRVNSDSQLTSFMRYVFRRGMVMLYLGLILAYGTIGFIGTRVAHESVNRIFYGILFTSTILHYYYDGFIWKMREPTNQASLGLRKGASDSLTRWMASARSIHNLKWSFVVIALGSLFVSDFLSPPLSTNDIQQLRRDYSSTLVGKPKLPESDEKKSWLLEEFHRTQQIAAAVPDDLVAQVKAAVMLANFGRNDEAERRLNAVLQEDPNYRAAHVTLADIHFYRGNLEQAESLYASALPLSETGEDRSIINLRLGEIDLRRDNIAEAKVKFQRALRENPELAASVDALRVGKPRPSTAIGDVSSVP